MVYPDGAAIHHRAIDVLYCRFSIFACEIADKTEATGRSFVGIQTHDQPFNVTSFGEKLQHQVVWSAKQAARMLSILHAYERHHHDDWCELLPHTAESQRL